MAGNRTNRHVPEEINQDMPPEIGKEEVDAIYEELRSIKKQMYWLNTNLEKLIDAVGEEDVS